MQKKFDFSGASDLSPSVTPVIFRGGLFFLSRNRRIFQEGAWMEKNSLLQGDYPHRFLSRKYSLKDSKNRETDPPFQFKEHGCNTVISQR